MSDASVRPATVDDATAIAGIRLASWQATYGALLPPGALDGYRVETIAERLAQNIADGRLTALLAERDGTAVAYSFYGPARDDDLGDDIGEVYAIYAHPDHWSTGAGRTLLAATLDRLGAGIVVLWVLEANARARRFYELAGFHADGATKPADMPGGTQLPEIRYRTEHQLSTGAAS